MDDGGVKVRVREDANDKEECTRDEQRSRFVRRGEARVRGGAKIFWRGGKICFK